MTRGRCNKNKSNALPRLVTMSSSALLLLLLLLVQLASATATTTNDKNVTSNKTKTTSGLLRSTISAGERVADAVNTSSTAAISGYGIAQTLDFADNTTTITTTADNSRNALVSVIDDQDERDDDDGVAVINTAGGISNGHQNGMLLMAMLLDNKTNIENAAKETKPALAAIFDFNPEDIQDLHGNDFYSVDTSGSGSSNSSGRVSDNEVGETAQKESPSAVVATEAPTEESLWTLTENPIKMPLVMVTNGQALPGAAMEGSGGQEQSSASASDDGNIYKVKLRRRQGEKKRERHLNISSQMSVLGNDLTTITQFQTLVSMFNHWNWDAGVIAEQVSRKCELDMNLYLESLKNGELWALKVADSSGRYRGQFMFGNVFWMGSKSFCLDVNFHNLAGLQTAEVKKRSLPNMHYLSTTLKLDLHSLINKTKIIQVGQCLPASCSISDVENILCVDPSFVKFNTPDSDTDSGDNKQRSISMIAARPVPGPYNLWTDPRFQILGIGTGIICVIVLIATLVESKIDANDAKFSSKSINHGIPMKETRQNGSKSASSDTQITVLSSEYTNKGFKDSVEIIKESDVTTNSGRKCPSEQNIFMKFLLCFSLISNGKAIMCLKTPSKDSLTSIHGIRLFSLLWTIMVHTYLQFFALAENRYGRKIAERSFGYQMIGNASFAVDTFFFLSGLLVALLFLRKGERASRQKSVFAFIGKGSMKASLMFIYRYLRLTPVYLVAIIANELSLKHTYNQSVFSPSIYDHVTCHHFWWRNILYINNWYPFQELCMIWSWYLANDMQFYLMAIFLLILSTRFMKTSVVISMVILFASIVASAVISMKYEYVYKVAEPFEAFDILYDKPWLRVGPYLMGMIGGFVLAKWAKGPKISSLLNITLWIVSIVIQFLLVFGTWDGNLSVPKTAIYVSVGHAAWGLSLMWMVMSCYWGMAPPINKLLSYRAFLPLSRLTYCTYLLHPMLMVITSFRMEAPFHLQHVLILTAFLGNAIIAFLVALVASLLYEAPVIRVLKLIFRK